MKVTISKDQFEMIEELIQFKCIALEHKIYKESKNPIPNNLREKHFLPLYEDLLRTIRS
jgi:hypothetical protein